MDTFSRYDRIVAWCAAQVWAVTTETLGVICDVLSYRAAGHRLPPHEIESIISEARRNAQYAAPARVRNVGTNATGNQVAVIPIRGVIGPRASQFASTSQSGTGIDEVTQTFRRALADDAVGSIMFDIDSPGGVVQGVPELATEIRKARGQKPILALANGLAASAAYWIGSQADEFTVTPSGEAGSIGVFAAHTERTKQLENLGLKTTLISAGKHKVEGNPFEPLSEDAREFLQGRVNEAYDSFLSHVAKGRGVTVATVKRDFGEGRTFSANVATERGMVDRVATFDDVLGRALAGKVEPTKAKAETESVMLSGAHAEALAPYLPDSETESANEEGAAKRAPNWQTSRHRLTF